MNKITISIFLILIPLFSLNGIDSEKKFSPESTVIMFDFNGVLAKGNYAKSTLMFLRLPHKGRFIKGIFKNKLSHALAPSAQSCNCPRCEKYCNRGLKLVNYQKVRKGMYEIVQRLHRQGYCLILFSNVYPESIKNLRMRPAFAELFNLFHGFALSCSENEFAEKPESQMFSYALRIAEKRHPSAKQHVLIDNEKRNIKEAERQGITGIRFHSAERLKRQLIELGIL